MRLGCGFRTMLVQCTAAASSNAEALMIHSCIPACRSACLLICLLCHGCLFLPLQSRDLQ